MVPIEVKLIRRIKERHNAVRASFWQQAIDFVHDPQWVIPGIVAPFLFTLVLLMIQQDADGPVVLRAVLGGGVLGMWGNTIFKSSESIMYDRRNGTLEPIMAALAGLNDIIIGRSLWNALVGMLNGLLVLVVAEVMFDAQVRIADPPLFLFCLLLTLLSLAAVGMLFSALFVYTRRGQMLSSMLEYPLYVLSGALVPVMLLPEAFRNVSLFLAPTWGVDAMNLAADATYAYAISGNFAVNLGMLAFLAISYYVIATVMLSGIEREIRNKGTAVKF